MTMQELANTYKNIDEDTLGFIREVLQWRRNVPSDQREDVPEVWRKMQTLLRQEDEVSEAELTRLAILDESSRLIRQRNDIREQIRTLKQANEACEAEMNELKREKEKLEELKQDHADFEKQKSNLQKEQNEMRRKCVETRQLVNDGQRSNWLRPDVKSDIQRIWRSLPVDSLDMFLEE